MDQLLDEPAADATAKQPKLPVLFHLLDVSRPRATQAVVVPTDLVPTHSAGAPASALERELTLAPLPPPAPAPFAFPPLAEPPATAYEPQTVGEVASQLAADEPTRLEPAKPEAVAPPVTIATAPPAPQPAVEKAVEKAGEKTVELPKSRAAPRRPKAKAADDWFAAHGKFIAVAFVVALVGTIYFARTTRRQSTVEEEAIRPVAPLIELTSASDDSQQRASTPAAAAAPPLAQAPAATSASVELHMPTSPAPQVAAAGEKPRGGDSLFIFPAGKPGDQRSDARPEAAQVAATPPAAATMPPAYPVTGSPPLVPAAVQTVSYPQTTAPPLAASGVPAGNPATMQPTSPPLPYVPPQAGYGGPGFDQSPENVARGPRYERTGSGNY